MKKDEIQSLWTQKNNGQIFFDTKYHKNFIINKIDSSWNDIWVIFMIEDNIRFNKIRAQYSHTYLNQLIATKKIILLD